MKARARTRQSTDPGNGALTLAATANPVLPRAASHSENAQRRFSARDTSHSRKDIFLRPLVMSTYSGICDVHCLYGMPVLRKAELVLRK
jgi:hypothetical protein